MRLSNRLRIGIVLSVVWAIGAGVYQRNDDLERAHSYAEWAHETCVRSKALKHETDLTPCAREKEERLTIWLKDSWRNVASYALVPIPFAWLAAFILIYVGRAQLVGFKAVIPWAQLSRPKKAVVVFCALSSAAFIVLAMNSLLNLYVETKVPVALPPKTMVFKIRNDMVTAQGTWMRSGSGAGSGLGFPLQTSTIECVRRYGRCTEARAVVSGNVLTTPELLDYEIESWGETTIVFKYEAMCAAEVFTIDLKTESVNGIGRTTNRDEEFCKIYNAKQEQQWQYRLSDGFKVYWELRQKARPLPLRLVQTLFGN